MQEFFIVLNQLIQLFVIFGIGCLAMKQDILTEDSLPLISKLIAKILLPVFIFINIVKEGSWQKLMELAPASYLTAAIYISLGIAFFIVSKLARHKLEHGRVFQAVFMFSNVGFVGIPIFFSLYPQDGPIYIAWITIVDQFLIWTYGVFLTSGNTKFNFRQMLNPAIYGLLCALIVMLLDIKLPSIFLKTFYTLGSTATPLCMLYMGAMFYAKKPFWVLKSKDVYLGIALKMIVFPLIAGLLMYGLPVPASMKGMMMILVALPPMILIPMIVPEKSKEKNFAVGGTLVGIVASLFTIPMVVYIFHILVG
ncbi:MAG: AEC family transporter [Phascolarctobacterium sp.]|nr:AEC family transporter [Phascolarctobacterium sp.]